MNVAIIPARGGSKRIPRKNIRHFHGKPIIAWSIEVARASGLFSHVVVSTDDDEIAEISESFGADVPFLRPPGLADDHSATVPVIAHALKICAEKNWDFDFACCIYPCAPFILSEDLFSGLEILESTGVDYVYPVSEFPHPIQRAMRRTNQGRMTFLDPQNEIMRTQDLPETYHDVGQFYWGRRDAWMAMKNMHSDGFGLIIPSWRVADIDTLEDWHRAEMLFDIMRVS